MVDLSGVAFPATGYTGMTMREYYAGQALVGLTARETMRHGLGDMPTTRLQHTARLAVAYADALLEELKK